MLVYFYANGGRINGMGHIMRCSVLADAFRKKNCDVCFVCESSVQYDDGAKLLAERDFPVIRAYEHHLIEVFLSNKPDIIVVDSYDVDELFFESLYNQGMLIGALDDINRISYSVDFVLNQNIYAEKLDYSVPQSAALLCGPKYLLLRDEFLNTSGKEWSEWAQRCLITVGGSDPEDLTGELVEQLAESHSDIMFDVVVGPSFPHSDSLAKRKYSNVVFHHSPVMSELMQRVDCAVTACGSTIYELAVCGVPSMGIVVADNQTLLADEMSQRGLIVLVGHDDDYHSSFSKLLDAETRRSIQSKMEHLFSCNGAENAAQAILSLGDKA